LVEKKYGVRKSREVIFLNCGASLSDQEAVGWSVGVAWRKGDTNPALIRLLDLLRKDLSNAAVSG